MRFLVLFCFSIAAALDAQSFIAPDIERGMAPEAVIRLHGWPKGKSVSGDRESWAYESFQVMFERGGVISVTPWTDSKKKPNPQPARAIQPPVSKPSVPAVPPPTRTVVQPATKRAPMQTGSTPSAAAANATPARATFGSSMAASASSKRSQS